MTKFIYNIYIVIFFTSSLIS